MDIAKFSPGISVILPVFNETSNLFKLCDEIVSAMESAPIDYEVIFVDDGSTDNSWDQLEELTKKHSKIRAIQLTRNYGQTTAMLAGFDNATLSCVVVLDADGQNDPADIPKLYAKLSEGYELVSGWRVNRKDNAFIRNFPSKIANWLISRVGGVKLHDYGCSLKAYDTVMLKKIRLYGEMHRFIPLYMADMGARYTELPVNHRPRVSGVSKYGLERIFKVLFDLIVVHYFIKYKSKPSYFLGSFSLIAFLASIVFATWALALKILIGASFVDTPLLMLSGLAFLICLIFIALTIQLDMMMRIYFESSQESSSYGVRRDVS